MLSTRRENDIAIASQIDVPQVAHQSMLVLVHRLDGGDKRNVDAPLQITVLNFSGEPIEGTVRSKSLTPRSGVIDAETGETIAKVDDLQSFPMSLPPYGGLFLLLEAPDPEAEAEYDQRPLTRAIPIITGA